MYNYFYLWQLLDNEDNNIDQPIDDLTSELFLQSLLQINIPENLSSELPNINNTIFPSLDKIISSSEK